MLKICRVLIGPISDGEGKVRHEGDEILVDEGTAEVFTRWGHLEILDKQEPSNRPDQEEPTHSSDQKGSKRSSRVVSDAEAAS